MKTYLRYTLLCLFALSSALCGAEKSTIRHNFDDMYKSSPKKLEVTNYSQTGRAVEDGIVYTCSDGAVFSSDISKSGGKVAVFLEASGHKVTTTQIQNLDSIWIQYAPDAYKKMTVQISTDSVSWTDVVLDDSKNSIRKAKLQSVGSYYVRIVYKSSHNVYIKRIEYYCLDLSGCPNCFLYKPE